jgi:hypothetical protein
LIKPKVQKTLDYLQTIADNAEHDGYFYIDVEKTWRDLDISRRTLFNHIDKLEGSVYKVFNGSFVPDKLTQKILKDSGKKIKTISSLYYIPIDTFDSQLDRDIAILKYCFEWPQINLRHFLWWSDLDKLELDECLTGLSKKATELLNQYFKYMVDNQFDFVDEGTWEEFESLKRDNYRIIDGELSENCTVF